MKEEPSHPWPRILLFVLLFAVIGIVVTTQSGIFRSDEPVAPITSASNGE